VKFMKKTAAIILSVLALTTGIVTYYVVNPTVVAANDGERG